MWRGPNIDVLLSELAGAFLVFYLGLDPAIPSTDRAASTRDPGVQRAFPSILTVAVGAGGGLASAKGTDSPSLPRNEVVTRVGAVQ